MKKLKLFPKIFLYTFLVMLLVTLASHLFLYMFAPQMQINASRFLENGVMMETTLNTEWIIQDAIFKALPISLGTNTVDNTIWRLRNKLEANPKHPTYIKTVFRVGYKIEIAHG